ncbi:hypothetical protein COCCU_04215 [Corynebacterium occultum]|uniref:CueP family metal-binding protein n=1 Tax=Corynebacterium occultum TaxID=2675219 RepID=A0A6B8W2V4_9CORY|nr:CueP family metal-binding protein [Corynebacterium occultum]QGU06791.1 hypothetical protein COCCU_04215 [Corynebacterium occultum]
MKLPSFLTVGVLALLALSGCAAADTNPEATHSALADFEGQDARTLIEELDATPVAERRSDIMASIRADELLISDASGAEMALPLPADEFYVSVAPYATQTHDCFYHSLTTCLGELDNQAVQVKVVAADGGILVDQEMSTFDNGFLGLWLPRDINATLSIEHERKSSTQEISTGAEAATCLTTLQLT